MLLGNTGARLIRKSCQRSVALRAGRRLTAADDAPVWIVVVALTRVDVHVQIVRCEEGVRAGKPFDLKDGSRLQDVTLPAAAARQTRHEFTCALQIRAESGP